MKITIIDTQAVYRQLLALNDDAEREALFRDAIVAPFDGLVRRFGGTDGVVMFKQWLMSADQFTGDQRAWASGVFDGLTAYGAWDLASQALDDANKAFAPYHDKIPLESAVFALLICDINKMPLQRGYSGNGGMPGYIMTLYGEASDYSLSRLQGATVHEFHHNIRFTLFPFTMQVTLGEYIIAEGLAESFSKELYGADKVGFYVTDFDQSRLDETKAIISNALTVTGFNEVRGYIFGDAMSDAMGMPKVGVPNFAGYAIGYQVVQAYLERTGKTVAEATFIPAMEIISESGFFGG
jgi:uncharacterized protein YjaZ